MDELSTPPHRQTSSSRSPSVGVQSNASPTQLTPRSKIKALLAAVDDRSDGDLDQEPGSKLHRNEEGPGRPIPTSSSNRIEDESSSNSDGAPVIPRGRLAARLHCPKASNDAQIGSEADGEEQAGEGVYEKIKRQLLRKEEVVTTQESESIASKDSTVEEGSALLRAQIDRESRSQSRSPVASPVATPKRSPYSSLGLFLTPGSASPSGSPRKATANDDSDSDLPADPQRNERFLALVARKRAEREAKQAVENEKKAAREARWKEQSKGSRVVEPVIGGSEDDSDDDAAARRLTQQARPTRKASRKALEEMSRETQRMSRNMQLAHQAKTKKKITKESLFARFNFRTTGSAPANSQHALGSSTAASSVPPSDSENNKVQETPPSSPPRDIVQTNKCTVATDDSQSMLMSGALQQSDDVEDDLPDIQDIMSQPQLIPEEGKDKSVEHGVSAAGNPEKHTKSLVDRKKHITIRSPRVAAISSSRSVDSDSDLEILPKRKPKGSKLDVFSRSSIGKASETRSLQNLRALAHLNSPPKKQSGKSKPFMTMSVMQTSLQKRARQQAAAERAEKIQDLKNRGIVVQTAQERQKDQVDIDDLVEKARLEAEMIKKQEKDAAKKERTVNGNSAHNDTTDDDEDYQEQPSDKDEIDLSGSDEDEGVSANEGEASNESEDEDEDDEDGGVDLSDHATKSNGLFEDEAVEDAESESLVNEETGGDAHEADNDEPSLPTRHRRPRASRIIDSDEDEEPQPGSRRSPCSSPNAQAPPAIPMIPCLDNVRGPVLPMMGMTQAFAATMADTQTQPHEGMTIDQEQDSLSFLGPIPEPDFPVFDLNDTDSIVMDSQDASNATRDVTDASCNIELRYSQAQVLQDAAEMSQDWPNAAQEDDIPDPTQDMGFGMSSPAANRFVSVPPSTIETILLADATSPLKKKRGRLQRRHEIVVDPSYSQEEPVRPALDPAGSEISAIAFDVMKKRRALHAKSKEFDKKKSEAKEMVEEQAAESEDEYAGLGGASDDESGGSEDEEVRQMIEHGEIDVDEGRLAAFYADKERTRDTAAISKLYKDITSGGLRRHRGGADFDLSDSEDDVEARHRAKRREEAKLRKALLEDERLGKIAEDPKKLAFLRAIEDREEEMGFLLEEPEQDSRQIEESTQETAGSQSVEQTGQKRKRPLSDSVPDAANRPPPAARRSKGKKPSTLAEIRETVSFLIETPYSASFIANASSPPESEDENGGVQQDENATVDRDASVTAMPPPTRNPRRTGPSAFTDRLALLRSNTSASSSTRFAFASHDVSTSNSSFRVPTLLRRATTSNLTNVADANGISHLATTEQAAGGEKKGVMARKGARKGCSILGAAREVERRAVVEGVERRRKEERERLAKVRRDGMGALGAGGGWEL